MKEITHENVHSVCRTCLQELQERSPTLRKKYSLYANKELEKLLKACTTMPLEDNIELPEFVCYECHEKLRSFYEFCSKSTESICILTNILREYSGIGSDKGYKILHSDHESDKEEYFNEANKCAVNCKKTNLTKSRGKLKNCIENTDVKILQEPIGTNKNYKNEFFDEIRAEAEIDVAEITVDSDVEVTEYLEITREPQDKQNDHKEQDDDCDKSSHSETYHDLSKIDNSKQLSYSQSKRSQKSTKSSQIILRNQSQIKHSGKAKFQCEQCPRRCVTWENYQAHLRTHQGLRPYVCNECGRSFNRAVHCRDHVRDVHAPVAQQFICSFEGCGKIFKREGSYKKHYRLKHSPTYVHREPKKYVCEDCGSTFKNVTTFKDHRYKHVPVENYPFKCEECGKRFISKRTYTEHQLRHSGIKNFVCPHCGMKKTTKNELRSHINYHTKEKQWPCSKCPSVFNSSANLGMHDRIVHKGIRRFACKHCDQTFGKQDTLKHHEMRHTGEKPHGCELCGKRFIQIVALRAHMKTHNKDSARKSIKLPVTERISTKADLTRELIESSS